MRIWGGGWWITTLALVVVHVGCSPGEREAEVADEAPAAEAAITDEGGTALEGEAAAEPQAGAPEGPGAVAPADEAEVRVMRNFVLLEFSRPLEATDLEWLQANGFHVDSVMSELRVRGWLERPEGGRVIAGDPRIARVHTQMR